MLATTTTNIEHVSLDGPVGLSVAIAIGVALLGLFAWSLWREHRILGRQHTALFWGLRAIALGTVIWMLLAPMNVRVETSTTRRAVTILTDVSGSMQTVDPAGTSDDLRWAAVSADGQKYAATRSADRALAAIGIAQRHLQIAAEALKQHKPESFVVESTTAADQALSKVREHLQVVQDESASRGKTRSLAARLRSELEGSEFETFALLCKALRKGRTPSQTGWRESIPDLEHRIASLNRALHELARLAEADEATLVAQDEPTVLNDVRNVSRLGRAAGFVERLHESLLKSLGDKADVRLSTFDRSITALPEVLSPGKSLSGYMRDDLDELDDPATVPGTDIAAVLEQINRDRQDQPIAAAFVISDVGHNEYTEDSPREIAATIADTPVFFIPVGNPEHVRDVILQSVYAPSVAMRNDDIVIEANIQAYDCEGEVCTVQLLQDGEVVDFREVVLDTGFASRTVRFEQMMPSIGNQQFQVAMPPLDGELTQENNFDEFEVNVTRSDIKVLLSDEMPRWEYRYLAQLFRRDAKINCDELLFQPRMIATGKREATQTFPVTVDDWDQYDVVMLGDLPTDHLPVAAQESLIEYVKKRGGTVVLIAGHEAMPQSYVNHPIEDILPVLPIDSSVRNSDSYAFRVTKEGSDHHALMIGETEESTRIAWDFVNRFSPLHFVSDWRMPRASARTLISAVSRDSLDEDSEAKRSAFLCWQPVGRGRVVYLSGPDTYRLRFLRGDLLHYRFWGQLLRWAIASDISGGTKFVRIRTDRSRYATRDDVHVSVRLTDEEGMPVVTEGLQVRITSGEDSRTVPLPAAPETPGEYHAVVTSLTPGVYRVEPVGETIDELQNEATEDETSASFTVQADVPMELVDTRCDRALAQQISDITGGQVLPPTAVEEILELTNLEPIVAERIETRPLWLQWKYLWIVFGCLQIEWAIRKWKGLS